MQPRVLIYEIDTIRKVVPSVHHVLCMPNFPLILFYCIHSVFFSGQWFCIFAGGLSGLSDICGKKIVQSLVFIAVIVPNLKGTEIST